MRRFNRRMVVPDGFGGWKLRIFHRRAKNKKSARFLVKCGCCDSSVEIYYDEYGLEVNGVNATYEEWQNFLLPILERKGLTGSK